MHNSLFSFFFFFNDTATTEIYTLSLHDALPISIAFALRLAARGLHRIDQLFVAVVARACDREMQKEFQQRQLGHALVDDPRSEEHTSELQSRLHLVCRLLLEKKKHIH